MKDQHKQIKGYRDLTQEEIDLMNRIKTHAEETKRLLEEVTEMRRKEPSCVDTCSAVYKTPEQLGESMRCLALAKTNLQQGNMWFVRAVALPDSF